LQHGDRLLAFEVGDIHPSVEDEVLRHVR
jgi:hypothetical protein